MRELAKLLPLSVPEAISSDDIAQIGGLSPTSFAASDCSEDRSEDWECIDPMLNRFLGIDVPIDTLVKRIRWGDMGVTGLLNFLEWFTHEQGLNSSLYEMKIQWLSDAMLKLIPSQQIPEDPSATAQIPKIRIQRMIFSCTMLRKMTAMHP